VSEQFNSLLPPQYENKRINAFIFYFPENFPKNPKKQSYPQLF